MEKTKALIYCEATALFICALCSRMQERGSAPRSGGTGFAPGQRHTKVLKMVLVIQIFRVGLGLFALVSVLCDWKWLGLDTIMRQHYDVEHSIEPPKITNEALNPLSQPDTVLV